MLEKRRDFPLIFFSQRVFAVGGYDDQRLSSVEYFDDYENKWKKVSPMKRARDQHAVFVHNNRLYAVGGTNDVGLDPSMEYYDPSIDKWSLVRFFFAIFR